MNRRLQAVAKDWPRYVAEVLVIVGSILAAFALDGWRDDQSRRAEEIAILTTALAEVERDLEDIDYNIRWHELAVGSLDVVIAQLENDAPYHDSLAAHFHNAFNMPRFVHSTGAFETMQSTGMDVVSNEALRRDLIRLYGAFYTNYRTAEAGLADEIAYGLRTIGPGRFVEGFHFTEVGRTYRGRMVPTDFEALKQDREFLYYMKTLRNRTYTFVNFYYRNLRGEVEEMRDLLEEEVGPFTGRSVVA